MNLRAYFLKVVNQRKMHILELLILKDELTDKEKQKRLDKKIQSEQIKLNAINHIWRLPC